MVSLVNFGHTTTPQVLNDAVLARCLTNQCLFPFWRKDVGNDAYCFPFWLELYYSQVSLILQNFTQED